MPTLFFHLAEGEDSFQDFEGVALPDLAAAERHAHNAASELIAEAVRRGDHNYRGRLEVVDNADTAVLTLTFAVEVGMEVRSEMISGGNVHRLRR